MKLSQLVGSGLISLALMASLVGCGSPSTPSAGSMAPPPDPCNRFVPDPGDITFERPTNMEVSRVVVNADTLYAFVLSAVGELSVRLKPANGPLSKPLLLGIDTSYYNGPYPGPGGSAAIIVPRFKDGQMQLFLNLVFPDGTTKQGTTPMNPAVRVASDEYFWFDATSGMLKVGTVTTDARLLTARLTRTFTDSRCNRILPGATSAPLAWIRQSDDLRADFPLSFTLSYPGASEIFDAPLGTFNKSSDSMCLQAVRMQTRVWRDSGGITVLWSDPVTQNLSLRNFRAPAGEAITEVVDGAVRLDSPDGVLFVKNAEMGIPNRLVSLDNAGQVIYLVMYNDAGGRVFHQELSDIFNADEQPDWLAVVPGNRQVLLGGKTLKNTFRIHSFTCAK